MDFTNDAIAIDGPAGAGKSSIAKEIASRLDMKYVDTGAIYRGLAYLCIDNDVNLNKESEVESFLKEVNLEVIYKGKEQYIIGNNKDITAFLRTDEISQGASQIGTYPCVREKLLNTQRDIARFNKVVMDGRDIGSVVLPTAKLKIYLTASARERAIRRLLQKGVVLEEKVIQVQIKDIELRDQRDMERSIAPLKKCSDALLIDSTNLTIEEVIQTIVGAYR